jgi:hypothetical protein
MTIDYTSRRRFDKVQFAVFDASGGVLVAPLAGVDGEVGVVGVVGIMDLRVLVEIRIVGISNTLDGTLNAMRADKVKQAGKFPRSVQGASGGAL